VIDYANKRLSVHFLLILVLFAVSTLAVIAIYFHQGVVRTVKRHVREVIEKDFVDQFRRTGVDPAKPSWEEYHFQILNSRGDIVVSSKNSAEFYPALNRELLGNAFTGGSGFETTGIHKEMYLVSYFPLDERFAGRLAVSLESITRYEKDLYRGVLVIALGILLLSYLVSRYLVRQAMKPVSDAFAYQENFSSSVGHELRSPLASLKGNLEVTLRKERSAEEYQETMAFCLTEVDRIIALLNDLSFIASSRFKPLDLFKEEVDLGAIITELCEGMLARIQVKKISIRSSFDSGGVCVCDKNLMRRVFENVLNNAANYTPEGGKIIIHMFEGMGKVLVNVSNTSTGLNRDELPDLFKPFYRGKDVVRNKKQGKGLGLFIARYIVRSHGGQLTAKLTDAGMFSLTVSMPLKRRQAGKAIK
jgi:signal transduction histidine kinase